MAPPVAFVPSAKLQNKYSAISQNKYSRQFLLFANAFLAVVPFSSLSRHLICSSPTLSFISPAIFLYSLPAFFTFLVLVFLNFHFFKS